MSEELQEDTNKQDVRGSRKDDDKRTKRLAVASNPIKKIIPKNKHLEKIRKGLLMAENEKNKQQESQSEEEQEQTPPQDDETPKKSIGQRVSEWFGEECEELGY